MNYNKNTGYGMLQAILAQNGVASFGKVLIVVEDGDTANYQRLQEIFNPDSDGVVRFYNTLAAAYDAATSDAGDIILMSANTTHIVDPFAWNKNRITVIGLDGGNRLIQQGTKLQNSTTDTDAYVLSVTGSRNNFINLKFIQASTNAAALSVVQMGGEGNEYKNCSFVFSVANNLNKTTAHEVVCGEDSGTFINCTFGSDTLVTSAARSVFHVDQVTTGQEFKSNYFENCRFMISSSSGTATFIRLDAITDILFTNEFKNTSFLASVDSGGGAALAEAVQTGTGTNKGTLLFTGTLSAMNCTKVSTATGGRNTAIQIVVPASAATGGIGITPTA